VTDLEREPSPPAAPGRARRAHRWIGLVLLLPFLAWGATGLVFYFKPGYGGAYAALEPRWLPLLTPRTLPARPDWLEARSVRTVLGEHLLVRTASGWHQLDPQSLEPRPAPAPPEQRRLVADALAQDALRYGDLVREDGGELVTSTGVRVALDWDHLTLSQHGRDTDRIDALYRVHYLQWTGVRGVDRVLGLVGIGLVFVLAGLGVRLAVRGKGSGADARAR